jgi:hypothetical protein
VGSAGEVAKLKRLKPVKGRSVAGLAWVEGQAVRGEGQVVKGLEREEEREELQWGEEAGACRRMAQQREW